MGVAVLEQMKLDAVEVNLKNLGGGVGDDSGSPDHEVDVAESTTSRKNRLPALDSAPGRTSRFIIFPHAE